ncbi:MAG: adenylosuccinate synthase [Anaerolineales bacterium]
MTVTVVSGMQWGDEGKGKAIDVFAAEYDFVARFNGGNNAGHTVINAFGTFKIHLVPSGIFHPHTRCLMGSGMVIDPKVLLEEMSALQQAGISLEGRLFISPRAHVIFPYHKVLDGLYEEAKGAAATGTTRRGIGPTFADKFSYNGIRWSDFRHLPVLRQKLALQLELKNRLIGALSGEPLALEPILDEYYAYYEQLRPYITELFPIVQQGLRDGKRFLLEQAMGTCLDPDWGTYPFVTASTTIASAATSGLGIPPRAITQIIGVTKAYTTRVGAGPMPTEIHDDSHALQVLGEVAATTGRRRRAGWFDAEIVRFATQIAGVDRLFLTKLDVLSAFERIKICVGYRYRGEIVHYYDLDSYQLAEVEPIYEELPGWQQEIGQIRAYHALPQNARRYVERIESLVGVPVSWISVGPEREAVITRIA